MEDVIEVPVPTPSNSNLLKLGKVVFSAVVGFAATEGAGKIWDAAQRRFQNR